jgi:RNA polymerase primary sigma factor
MKAYLQHITDCGSLDAKTNVSSSSGNEGTILDLLADPISLEEQEYKLDDQDIAQLFAYVDSLDERTAVIIKRRFGIDGHVEHTLDQIGSLEGISRERVRQIEKFAIRKLRMKLRNSPTCLGKTYA